MRNAPTTKKGRARREKIKAVTAALLEETSYYELTLEQITKRVGIPISVFYHYFPTKRELVLELLDEVFDRFRGSMMSAQPFGSFERGVLLNNRQILGLYEDHSGLMRCVAQVDDLAFAARWRDHMNWWRHACASGLREFATPGTSRLDLNVLIHALSAMTESFAHEFYLLRNQELRRRLPDIDSAARFLTTLWVRAIFLSNPQYISINEFPFLLSLRDSETQSEPAGGRRKSVPKESAS
ncbi:MAG TPA: TetR/AcrR family transcriptional regulator [Rhizomicrobium sp.]